MSLPESVRDAAVQALLDAGSAPRDPELVGEWRASYGVTVDRVVAAIGDALAAGDVASEVERAWSVFAVCGPEEATLRGSFLAGWRSREDEVGVALRELAESRARYGDLEVRTSELEAVIEKVRRYADERAAYGRAGRTVGSARIASDLFNILGGGPNGL